MNFFRVFTWSKETNKYKKGGPLYVPKELQGEGRHDIPEDGVYYCSTEAISAVAENIKDFRNRTIRNRTFKRGENGQLALVEIQTSDNLNLIDLRDQHKLSEHNISPIQIVTHDRKSTQELSATLYNQGYDGFLWWSSLEAKWSNITLYESRVKNKLGVIGEIQPLNIKQKDVIDAASFMNIDLETIPLVRFKKTLFPQKWR